MPIRKEANYVNPIILVLFIDSDMSKMLFIKLKKMLINEYNSFSFDL